MICDTTQRLAVSALIADCEKAIPQLTNEQLAAALDWSVAKVRAAFAMSDVIRIGDHMPERANYAAVQDAVTLAVAEPDYLPSPNPAFPEMEER